jgi:hypothetical protein
MRRAGSPSVLFQSITVFARDDETSIAPPKVFAQISAQKECFAISNSR